MRTLITGGAGFIGSHLAERLLAADYEVYVLDDLSTGSLDNLAPLRSHAKFHWERGECSNVALAAELVDAVDCIYHLAAAVGVRLAVEQPVRTIRTNVSATEILLGLAARKRTPVFIASSSEVYGKSDRLPFREDGDLVLGPPVRGRWAYACSKLLDEFLALAYWKEHRLPTVVGRLFNTAGPRQTGRFGMVIPRLVGQALRGEPLTVYGDGRQTRSFCHVRDVVEALTELMRSEAAAYGEVFNVGSDQEVAMLDLARLVIEQTASRSSISVVPYEQAYQPGFEDMQRRVPDTSKIRRLLGWQPQRALRDILQDVAAYERGRLATVRPAPPLAADARTRG